MHIPAHLAAGAKRFEAHAWVMTAQAPRILLAAKAGETPFLTARQWASEGPVSTLMPSRNCMTHSDSAADSQTAHSVPAGAMADVTEMQI